MDKETGQQKFWVAKVLAFLTCRGNTGSAGEGPHAFVHWYTEDEAETEGGALLGMVRMKVSKTRRVQPNGRQTTVDFLDVIPIKDIAQPVLLQRDPTSNKKSERWFLNHFLR